MSHTRQTIAQAGLSGRRAPWSAWLLKVLALLVLLPGLALAVPPELSAVQLHHRVWTAREGAPEGARMMAQTKDGFLWFATISGLVRFDGVRFERYESSSGAKVPAAFVTAVYALPDGGLMVGWNNAAMRIRDGHAELYEEANGFPPGTVYGFQMDGAGALWAAITGGFARFDGKRWEKVGDAWGFKSRQAQALFVDRDGTLGALTETTLVTLAKGARSFRSTGGTSTSLSPIVQSPSGTYFYSDARGIRRFSNLDAYDVAGAPYLVEGTERKDFRPMLVDRDGALWFGATTGVGRIARPDGGKTVVELLGKSEGLGSRVLSLLEDRDGSIWLSTVAGVERLRAGRVTPLAGTGEETYPALMPQPDGSMRFAGLDRDLREIAADGSPRRVAPISVNCAYRDASGRAWYCGGPVGGAKARLFSEVGGRLAEVSLPDEAVQGRHILAVAVDGDSAPWISLEGQGIYRRQGSSWRRVTELRREGKLHSLVLTTDPRGEVWVGYSYDRVAHWKAGVVRQWVEKKDGLEIGHIFAMLATDRQVWAAGELGLALLDGPKFRKVQATNPDVLRGVTGIVQTKDGNLWLHGTAGAVLIEAHEVQRAMEQPGHLVSYRLFNADDGLAGRNTGSQCRPSLVAGPDGRLWFGTVSGVFSLDPTKVGVNQFSSNARIDAVVANDQGIHRTPGELALPPLTTSLRVDYTAPNLIAPERVKFRYRMEGVDSDWTSAGARRQAFYTNLEPGAYRFNVAAANEDGVWNDEPASVSFVIAPAWYQSRWFYAVCALLATAAVVFLHRLRVARIRAQTHSRLQARLLERERIARELHDTLIQGFQGLMLSFHAAMKRIPDGQQSRAQMEEALSRAEGVLAEGRDRVRGLRQSVVYDGDLRAALTEFADDLAVLHPAVYQVDLQGTERELHPVVLEEVYSIAREALANAFRHAAAQRIEARVVFGDEGLRIRISDDGKGIDPDVLSAGSVPGHWGLPGMRERAQKLGAKLRLRSGPGAGTDVELEIPAAIAYRDAPEEGWWRRLGRRVNKDIDDAELFRPSDTRYGGR